MGCATLILLDTQIVVWLNQEQDRLSKSAALAIADARVQGTGLAIADLTLWEFAMLATKNRISLSVPLSSGLQELESFYTVLPITAAIAEASMTFSPKFPSDPVDRLIAATALVHKAPLITANRRIRASREVPCIW